MLNYSEACARNQQPIFQALAARLLSVITVLEIGSGSGQHALHFSSELSHLQWQCSETEYQLPELSQNIRLGNDKLPAPLLLDVYDRWPAQKFDMIYTANTLHIMSWEGVMLLFSEAIQHLEQGGIFCCYGPFKYQGKFTSASNAQFDQWLSERDSLSGIRDIEEIIQLASDGQLSLIEDISMPANNQLLIFRHSGQMYS